MPAQNISSVSFLFENLIWKISADSQNNILVLELRDHNHRSVNFAAIDIKTNKVIWQEVKPEETWWVGLDTCYNGNIFLHTYKDPQNPEHEGILALDIRTGKMTWKDLSKTFYLISDDQLITTEGSEDNRKYISLEPSTGKVKRELSLKEVFRIASEKKEQDGKIRNPFHFSADHPYFSKISEFIKEITGKQAVAAADYMENGEQVIISFYLYTTEGLNNHLFVVNDEGQVIFRTCIAAQLKGIGFGTFFVFEKTLIFIKEKKELILLKLS